MPSPHTVLFGVYALLNLAIIVYSIALWFRGLPMQAIFIGLWAPTLDLLYVMALLTFDRRRRTFPSSVGAPRPTDRADDSRRVA